MKYRGRTKNSKGYFKKTVGRVHTSNFMRPLARGGYRL